VAKLEPGEIFNSNGPMLAALVERFGGQVVARYHAVDEADELRNLLKSGLEKADFLIVVGGVSVGERDLVKAELAGLGVSSDFWRVKVKPGKPFLYGRRGDQGVFGLPGNPVSAFTTFLLFVAPALQRWFRSAGEDAALAPLAAEQLPLPGIDAVAGEAISNKGDRPHYLRGRLDASGKFFPVGMQQSHAVFGLSRASALLRLDAGASVSAGERLRLWSLDQL
jgi:molybdopterin molybdotransferase